MKISLESLTIRAFRGIPDERAFEFDGRDIVVHGPNGSGKSTVLQAIEFLLTGSISAFHGSGTGGIRITEHVPNRRADPDDTVVRATFEDADGDEFRVYRRFANRNTLVAERRPPEFRALLEVAEQGLLHFTREELLELVIATPGDRKDQIYQLLNTSGIDERRRQLKRLARRANDENDIRHDRRREAARRITDVVGRSEDVIRGDGDDEILDTDALGRVVNRHRRKLGGDPILSIGTCDTFREGIASPVEQASHPLQRSDVRSALHRSTEWFADAPEFNERLDELRGEVRVLQADSAALSSLSELELVKQGREVVDETTSECPLCGTSWDGRDLVDEIDRRFERLDRIDRRVEAIRDSSTELVRVLERIIPILSDVIEPLADTEVETDTGPLRRYFDTLRGVRDELDRDLVADIDGVDPDRFDITLTNEDAEETVSALEIEAESLPARSEIEESWEDLKVLHDAYRDWRNSTRERTAYQRAATELDAAQRAFLAARDDILDDIYETVNERFAEFYRAINPDEGTFDPELSQTDTGVAFRVDFYDTGEHPPNALHSEGHQDLMGICLFLALVDRLSPLERAPVLLDDVVMAVDSDHRARFAEVLADQMDERFQIVVTTREDEWAKQLLTTGAVDKSIEFEDWTLNEGPISVGRR
jgi:energy-coupling factor transporter ATP-binding protein EcfA2